MVGGGCKEARVLDKPGGETASPGSGAHKQLRDTVLRCGYIIKQDGPLATAASENVVRVATALPLLPW
jgi:hypothetical protein